MIKTVFTILAVLLLSSSLFFGQQSTLLEQTINIIETNYYDSTFHDNNWAVLKEEYLEKHIESNLVDKDYIKKLLKEFGDPGIRYESKAAFATFMNEIIGETHIGIGLTEMYCIDINNINRNVEIIAPLPNSPAEQAGIRGGDLLVKINGISTKGWSLNEVMLELRLKKGESTILSIKRKGKTHEVTLTAELLEPITYPSYRIIQRKQQKVGMIWIPQFSQGISLRIFQILNGFTEQEVDAVVLDLRNNPGGFIGEAKAVLGLFIGEKPIAHNQSRITSVQMLASIGKKRFDKPLIVLTNEGTASAAELVAGALKYHKRGTVIGTITNGKGLIYSFLGLTDQSVIILPISRMVMLDGRDIVSEGLEPDIWLESKRQFKLQKSYKKDKQLKRALKELEGS